MLFCDTNAWTTGLFHDVYLGGRSPEVDALAGRESDLYLLCDDATPFSQDEFEARTDGPHRARMHEAYLAHVRAIGAPYLFVSGTHAERMRAATTAVDLVLTADGQLGALGEPPQVAVLRTAVLRATGQARKRLRRNDRIASSSRTPSTRHAPRKTSPEASNPSPSETTSAGNERPRAASSGSHTP